VIFLFSNVDVDIDVDVDALDVLSLPEIKTNKETKKLLINFLNYQMSSL
jgi:hypothetical protein